MLKKQAYEITQMQLQQRINEAGPPQSVHGLRAERCRALLKAWLQESPRPIGKTDFEDFVRNFMFHKGNYTSGADEYTNWLAEDIQWNFGFDPRKVEYKKSNTNGRQVQASSAYKETLEYSTEGPYSKIDEHPRTCPEHPGIQLRRVPTERPDGLTPEDAKGGDGIYQCPIDGETYSYTGGHEIEFTGSAASQIPDGLSKQRESSSGTRSNEAPYATANPEMEDVEPSPDGWNMRRRQIRPFFGKEGDAAWGSKEDKPEKGTSERPPKKSPGKQKKRADLFGPPQEMFRYCPDHEGVALARVTDKVYQCSLDGQVYDFEKGFETQDGRKYRGGSVAQMTPDSPGYYQSPHPDSLFPGVVQNAHLGDLLTKRASIAKEALDARGVETRFCNDIYDALAGDSNAGGRVNEIISHVRQGDGRPLNAVAQEFYERMDVEMQQGA